MKHLNGKTRVEEIGQIPELKQAATSLIAAPWAIRLLMGKKTVDSLGNTEDLLEGIDRLREVAKQGEYVYPLYEDEKTEVNLIHFPALKTEGATENDKPYIILCAGGGYALVSSISECYPVAAHFNRLGYTAFALTYRVGGYGVLPAPLEDLAEAIRFIDKNAEKFSVTPGKYIVNGFSAGGNLAVLWGTDNLGYKKYNLPKPEMLFALYAPVSPKLSEGSKVMRKCHRYMLGKKYTQEIVDEYSADKHMSKDFPNAFIVCCEDDDVVPHVNSITLKQRLDELGIPAHLEVGATGGHGFGAGKGTSVEGWPEQAIKFYESMQESLIAPGK